MEATHAKFFSIRRALHLVDVRLECGIAQIMRPPLKPHVLTSSDLETRAASGESEALDSDPPWNFKPGKQNLEHKWVSSAIHGGETRPPIRPRQLERRTLISQVPSNEAAAAIRVARRLGRRGRSTGLPLPRQASPRPRAGGQPRLLLRNPIAVAFPFRSAYLWRKRDRGAEEKKENYKPLKLVARSWQGPKKGKGTVVHPVLLLLLPVEMVYVALPGGGVCEWEMMEKERKALAYLSSSDEMRTVLSFVREWDIGSYENYHALLPFIGE